MPLAYSKNKQHIYNWRTDNKEHCNTLNRIHQKKYFLFGLDYFLSQKILCVV